MEFLFTSGKVLMAMIEISLIAVLGFLFFKLKLLNIERVRWLGRWTVNLLLPCLIFSHFIKNFNFDSPVNWWLYPVFGIVVSGIGFLIAKIFLMLDKSIEQKSEFISLVSFQNCGYLPLVLVFTIFPGSISQKLFIYIFLFIQGFNFIFWSFGIQLLTKDVQSKFDFKKMINAPFLSLLLSLILVATKWHRSIPVPIIQGTELIGMCTLPTALLSLGAILAGCTIGYGKSSARFLGEVIIAKLIIMPAMVIIFLSIFHLPKLTALLFIIEASMPAAINLSVVSFYYNAKCDLISQGVLITHLFGLVTIPLFLGLFSVMVKY